METDAMTTPATTGPRRRPSAARAAATGRRRLALGPYTLLAEHHRAEPDVGAPARDEATDLLLGDVPVDGDELFAVAEDLTGFDRTCGDETDALAALLDRAISDEQWARHDANADQADSELRACRGCGAALADDEALRCDDHLRCTMRAVRAWLSERGAA